MMNSNMVSTNDEKLIKNLSNYFLKGFALANQNLDIYFIGVGLTFIGFIANLFASSPIGFLSRITWFILLFLNLGFSLSIPLLLSLKQQSGHLNFQTARTIIFQNTKRIFLPGIYLMILFAILYVVFLGWLLSSFTQPHETISSVSSISQQFLKNWSPYFMLWCVFFAFFTFSPIYFSLENNGVLDSIKKSVLLSFKHLPYILMLSIVFFINYSIISLISNLIQNPFGQILVLFISQFATLLVSATTLIYYQNNHSNTV